MEKRYDEAIQHMYEALRMDSKNAEIQLVYNLALALNLKQLAEDIKQRLDTFERF